MGRPLSLLPDPELEKEGERLTVALERYVNRLLPGDLCQLIDPPIESIFRNARKLAGADGGAIWVTDAEQANLVVAFADPPDPKILGQEQPSSEGLISLVFASEQPICQNRISEDRRHSKRIDDAVGEKTESMMAVPFYLAGMLRGIFSVVRWAGKNGEETDGFSLEDFREFQRSAVVMERLVTLQLAQLILGLEL